MQLKLVVLAGARVPSYRRFMMPLLSVAVLLCGTASMFTGDALRFGWYGFGLCVAAVRGTVGCVAGAPGPPGIPKARKPQISATGCWFGALVIPESHLGARNG